MIYVFFLKKKNTYQQQENRTISSNEKKNNDQKIHFKQILPHYKFVFSGRNSKTTAIARTNKPLKSYKIKTIGKNHLHFLFKQ